MDKHEFFQKMDADGAALTYGEVLLGTGYSNVLPSDVDTTTRFSRNIPLGIPIVSAAMDTVTEHKMAIALAVRGGIGVIHRNLTPEAQAREVDRVKFFLNGLIKRPICVSVEDVIRGVLARREEKGYQFHSFPVVDCDGRLMGLLTSSEFDFCEDLSLSVKYVMTPRSALVTPPPDTQIGEAMRIMRDVRKKVLVLVDDGGKVAGMYVLSDIKRILSANSSSYNVDSRGNLRVAAAVGTGAEELARVDALARHNVDAIVIDTAHADTSSVLSMLMEVKNSYADLDVVVGNVSEGDSAERLAKVGADGIKVGQGPGSICTTRVVAGTGCPQVTAVYSCAHAVEKWGVPICADGGITNSGDIVVAIAAGAHNVMLGRMLAGTDETPGIVTNREGVLVKDYRGMGSLGALEASRASRERYRQSDAKKLVPEGVEGVVPYQGTAGNVLDQCVGGVRGGMGYIGAATIRELQECARFRRISAAGIAESHPHHILITRSAPNYPFEGGKM